MTGDDFFTDDEVETIASYLRIPEKAVRAVTSLVWLKTRNPLSSVPLHERINALLSDEPEVR